MKFLTRLAFGWMLCNATVVTFAQSTDQPLLVSGKVIDAQTGEAIEFAAVGIKGKSRGTITNALGVFQLSIPGDAMHDTLQFSMVGYHRIFMPVEGFHNSAVVKLTEAPMLLNEVVITDKPITAEYILKSINANLRKNYPVDAYALECFYREIKKENDRYISLLEAALVVNDKGYDQQKSAEIAFVREIRGSNRYVNRFSDFFQTNNLWRETMGLNAVRHPASRPSVFGKDKYQFRGTSMLNDKEVYVLVSHGQSGAKWQRTIYVDVNNYTLYRSEEVVINPNISWSENGSDTLSMRVTKGTSVFDFKEFKGRWYLQHLRFEAENEYFNPKSGKSFQKFTIINDLTVVDIYPNPNEITGSLPRLQEKALELQLTPYNETFWKNYNAVLQTPLEEKVMNDLMTDGEMKFIQPLPTKKKKKVKSSHEK